ncbi:S-layer homology domain-containing protein [Paenibacillus sp. H1-7]|uniref:S-layer homology domain-containing protein n=1 Tax=Paenibacillus sp. H1-7 TaxID=2282849 RepID=UPI001EF9A7B6|nr:S-layer homology domain-containing protein [Paenibacillus sp. H1-7]
MKRPLSLSLSTLLLLGSLVPCSMAAASVFTDVPDTLPNAPYIMELYNKQILDGVDTNRFAPDAPLTREQFAKMVVIAFSLKANGTEAPFTDVTNDWAKPYVASAYQHKLIQGAGPAEFQPAAPLTRQAAASIVWRWLEQNGAVSASSDKQPDVADADPWAQDAVRGIVHYGLRTEGTASLPYRSQEVMTRGDAAALIALSMKQAAATQQSNASQAPAATTAPGTPADKPAENKKPVPPSGNGESREQAIYYELYTTAETPTSGRTTFYHLDLETQHPVLFDTENAERILIYDEKGQYVSSHSSTSFVFDPTRAGTFYFAVEAKADKKAKLTANNGATREKAIDYEVWSKASSTIQLPEQHYVYFTFKVLKGSTYSIKSEPVNVSTSPAIDTVIFDANGSVIEQNKGSEPILLNALETASYTLRFRSKDAPSLVRLKLAEMGVSRETAIGIEAGYIEVPISHSGVTWLQLSLPWDRNYELKVEGVDSQELEPKERIEATTHGIYSFGDYQATKLPPESLNKYVLRLVGTPGNIVKVTFLDGKSISGAIELKITNGMGKSTRASTKIVNDRGTFYKVQLEAGKKYEFWSENVLSNDTPNQVNYDSGASKKEYITDLALLDANRVELAQSKDSRLTFTPNQSGVYYINFKPGTNSRGYYLNVSS